MSVAWPRAPPIGWWIITRALLSAVLPLDDAEIQFLDRLNDQAEIEPRLLTSDAELQRRILASPGLQWKALNVRKHRDANAD